MGEYIMLDPCSKCGSEVAIVTFHDQLSSPVVELVSHGVCTSCMDIVVLPEEKLSDFPHKKSQGGTNGTTICSNLLKQAHQ